MHFKCKTIVSWLYAAVLINFREFKMSRSYRENYICIYVTVYDASINLQNFITKCHAAAEKTPKLFRGGIVFAASCTEMSLA